jgi:hypothetical protein
MRRCPNHARLATALLLFGPTVAAAQYALAPTPVLDLHALTPELRLSGYVSVRGTERRDTVTVIVNRARVTAVAKPAPYAAVRVQVDFTSVGRTTGTTNDTVPAIALTDAFLQLVLPEKPSGGGIAALHPALIVGQFRTPFSLEFLTSFALLQTANRSAVLDRISPRRDIGALAQLVNTRRLIVQTAVVNGEGSNRLANLDGRDMALGRVTLLPIEHLAFAGKYLAQGSEHGWGGDGRWVARGAIVEGEYLARRGPFTPTTFIDSNGGYLLASYKVRPWLQPVVKWEKLHDIRRTGATTSNSRLTWTTVGLNLLAPSERVRFQLNGIIKSEHPVAAANEIQAQMIAIF